MTDLVIYHGGCTDGMASAYAAYQALPAANYWPGVYQNEPPWDLIAEVGKGERLYLLDFSYRHDIMCHIQRACAGTCWILDHHKTAMEDCRSLLHIVDSRNRWFGDFDMTRCGAIMAWEHFQPHSALPWLFQAIDARDRWVQPRPIHNDEIIFWVRAMLPHRIGGEYPDWHSVMREWNTAVEDTVYSQIVDSGRAIHRYFRQLVEAAKAQAYEIHMAGITFPVVNASYGLASEVAGELAANHLSGIAGVYSINGDNVTVSLRARSGNDVSELAKKFGGGGHAGAAGFRMPLAQFAPYLLDNPRSP